MAWMFEPPEKIVHRMPGRVYADFFSLSGTPFSITPDPRFLFFSGTHLAVIEKITYGIQCRMGFMLLTGEVGTGKTTLCRLLLDRFEDNARTVYIINPALNGLELIACILEDLGLGGAPPHSKKEAIDRLNRFLISEADSPPVVIIVDDAQTMARESLEDLRLLSNLETDENKLLQIVLVGQPELLTLLDQPELRQLKQRVMVHCRLEFLSREEIGAYIERRLAVAGNQARVRFDSHAVKQVFRASGGIPRMINKVCDLALTAAYVDGSHVVNMRHVAAARQELVTAAPAVKVARGPVAGFRRLRQALLWATLVVIFGLVWGYDDHTRFAQRAAETSTAPVVEQAGAAIERAAPTPAIKDPS